MHKIAVTSSLRERKTVKMIFHVMFEEICMMMITGVHIKRTH